MPNRLLTINIRNYLVKQPRRKRPARISRYVRFRIAKSTNIKQRSISISKELNLLIQKKNLYSMKPLKVNISIDKDRATVTPFKERIEKGASVGQPSAKAATETTKVVAEQKHETDNKSPEAQNAKGTNAKQ